MKMLDRISLNLALAFVLYFVVAYYASANIVLVFYRAFRNILAAIDGARAEAYAPKKVKRFAHSFDAALTRQVTHKSVMGDMREFWFPKTS